MILLISGASLSASPYINSYIEILEKNSIQYEIIYWNRDLNDIENMPSNYIPYNVSCNNALPRYRRIFSALKYYHFIINQTHYKKYSHVIVFTLGIAVLIGRLLKKYKGNYILDIRDYSAILKLNFLDNYVKKIISESAFTVISSEGFKDWLPKGKECRYLITHNIGKELIWASRPFRPVSPVSKCKLLTIGQIRDAMANKWVISELGHLSQYELIFAGFGLAVDELREFTENGGYGNVIFTGKYNKADEGEIVRNCDMINIFFMHGTNSDTLMSNRFYLSVLHRKPMIVREGTYQATIVKKFHIGVVVNNSESLSNQIEKYWSSFDVDLYTKGCQAFLDLVLQDICQWEKKFLTAIS